MKLCVGIPSNCGLPLWPPGNTVQLWPPTVASHCGLPLWEATVGIPLNCGLPGIPFNCGLPLWPPTVASHCGLPLWEAMGIPLKIALNQFAYVFLREATGGHSWRPWEYHSQLLLINFPMFSYRRPWEATVGGHGNTTQNCF